MCPHALLIDADEVLTAPSLPDQMVERSRRGALLPTQEMPVDIHGERRGAVAKPSRDRQ